VLLDRADDRLALARVLLQQRGERLRRGPAAQDRPGLVGRRRCRDRRGGRLLVVGTLQVLVGLKGSFAHGPRVESPAAGM